MACEKFYNTLQVGTFTQGSVVSVGKCNFTQLDQSLFGKKLNQNLSKNQETSSAFPHPPPRTKLRYLLLVPPTSYLLNLSRLHRAFQKFVVPWEINISQKLILSSEAPQEICQMVYGFLCKFPQHVGASTEG